MVFKIAGWVFSFEQVRTQLEKQGQQHQLLPDEFLATDLNYWLKERLSVGRRYRLSSSELAADHHIGSKAQRGSQVEGVSFYRFRELNADREVKKQVLKESGLNDEYLRCIQFFLHLNTHQWNSAHHLQGQ
ncbi:hypothetical protein BDR06DRAFT_950668 [Suillus hirtellus]|nr:hypothetical protein BDR06DRAFT_950668 [Suillus hirtellus]